MKEKFQSFGKAMLVPITLIAISGLFLGIGSVFTTELTLVSLGVNWDWYAASPLFTFFSVFKGLGEVIIGNLGVLFAVGCAFSLSRKEKGWAAFSALVCYLTMLKTVEILLGAAGLAADNTTVEALQKVGLTSIQASEQSALYTTSLGFFGYNSGVFGGIIVGCLVAWITGRFYKTKLPTALAFFAGSRTVPIVSLVAGGILGGIMYFVWPVIGGCFSGIATFVKGSGLVGTFVYRWVLESLVPFGLHPLLETPMYWTELGGSMVVDGTRVVGDSAIQLAQLASPSSDKLLVRAFMAGYGINDYALFPGIALAMWSCAKPQNRKKVAGLLIPTVISTVFFGVTEPILFTFLFAAPWLYFGVYAPLSGLGEVLSEAMGVSVYQGNIKDLIPFLFRPEKLNLLPYLILLPAFFLAAFFLFRFFITKFDIKTPGRDDGDDIELINSRAEFEAKAAEAKGESDGTPEKAVQGRATKDSALAVGIVEALGGADNIDDLDNCISRLRVIVKDGSKVADDEVFTKNLEAMGVIRLSDKAIQVIYGPRVGEVASEVHEVLGDE